MKRFRLTYLLLVLAFTPFQGSLFAQIMPPELYELQVFPNQPSTQDSVFVYLKYTSNDGCPDYYLEIDSIEPSFISIKTRRIDNSTKICTQAFTKFITKINLGPLSQKTKIYVDRVLLQIVNPSCILDRKGVVVKGAGACSEKLFISEYTPYANVLPRFFTLDKIWPRNGDDTTFSGFKPGDEVRFGAILIPTTDIVRSCFVVGDAVCCEIINTKPDCLMNKTGLVVPGIDGCTGQWFVQDLSPVYSYPRMYLIKNDGSLKAGTKVIFGATEYAKDTSMSILCPVFGIVNCFIYAEPVSPDTLAGTAYTGDSLVKAGTAILFQKGIRKALRANPLKNGRFAFPNLPAADYTVFVIPDRKLDAGYLPTFYINKLAYKNADYYTLLDGMNEIAVNLRTHEKRPGKGRIYGNLYYETSNLKDSILNYYGDKNCLYTRDNTMAINLPVILFNLQGTAVAWTMSDDLGNYEFDNIELDSYKIVTETAETQAESLVNLTLGNAVVGADMVLKMESVVEVVPVTQNQTFSMYPNPTSDKLYLQTTTNEAVRIFNSLGQLMMVHYLPAGTHELNVQHFNKGIYFVKMGSCTQKMIRK